MSQTHYAFNAPNADVVLVSTPDLSEFRVHRCILSTASPFFSDLFSLPQPPSDCPERPPVISVAESSKTLETLLRYVYPIPNPSISTLDELNLVLGAALKYDFAVVVETLRRLLTAREFLETSPTRVFAIASRHDLEEEAKLASRYTLNINILDCPLSDDLKYITAYSYHRLLNLHRRRSQAAQALLKLPENVKCMQCNGSSYGIFLAPKWWDKFMEMAKVS